MSMSTMMTNIILPHDVVIDILSRLPVKSLLRFRCVSKLWKNNFFNDPSFIKMHLNHSININYEHVMLGMRSCLYSIADDEEVVVEIDYPFKTREYGFKLFGSCNGLLLIVTCTFLCIWNPSAKEFKKFEFPKQEFSPCLSLEHCFMGFGYDKIIQNYKVVLIATFNDYSSEVKVYTLGSDSWRKIQKDIIPDTLALTNRGLAAGKLVNGVLHWVASRLITTSYGNKELDDDKEAAHIILSLNIEDEKCEEVQLPDFIDTKFQMSVEVLGGCLCIMCNFYHVCSEIWVMKDYGVKESWTKLFTIDQASGSQCFKYVRPVKFTKNGEVLFVKDNTSLAIYDPKHGSAKSLQIHVLNDLFETYTYVESLVSLNSGMFVGKEQAAWKRILKNKKKKDKKKNKNRCLEKWFESDTYVESLVFLNSDTLVEQEQEVWKRTPKNRKKDLCFF